MLLLPVRPRRLTAVALGTIQGREGRVVSMQCKLVRVDEPDDVAERLRGAGVACSVRGGFVRLSFHLYNDETDVELAAGALGENSRDL